ncbi:MAG: aquaporin [Pirellulaceae bacterium]|nr:aquaporin [Pirellulaceae bacterium]
MPRIERVLSKTGARRLVSETFGTFALVFAGTGAIVSNDLSGGVVTHVGIAITFGLIVLAMIYALGDISGAHLNPAVTLGLFFAKRFDVNWVLPYIASQCLGAILASLTLRFLCPAHETLGATLPSGSDAQSFILEFLLTFILMFVILRVSSPTNKQPQLGGVVIGSVVALEALFAGPICGASMNPARSLGPALVSMQVSSLWIYLTATCLGAVGSVYLSVFLQPANSNPSEA